MSHIASLKVQDMEMDWRLGDSSCDATRPGPQGRNALCWQVFSMKPITAATDLKSVIQKVEKTIRRCAMSTDKMPEGIQEFPELSGK